MKLYYDEIDSPIGPLTLISNGDQLIRIDYGPMQNMNEKRLKWFLKQYSTPEYVYDKELFKEIRVEIEEYFFEGRKTFSIPLLFHGTPFQKEVWQTLFEHISFGETKTYKEIASLIGNPKAVRAVGGAINQNPFSIVVPCHRVIGVNGKLVGYNGGLDKKEFLLQHEGILLKS
ncbi:methylated-DNA--[protein]-cysteine S-methyltransferase [Oceanobacillus piezotolerans]|uniref:Methylated-DNA--protein-cysteine methyltransferase n=1 Tax=Oceanobacillus piezotolerans TaxID=2448030 RepID=A0A498D7Y3_9BACI|nr:methylated-DNA--[protein]-cysteine S-methyltransferase [Oceanobacillus piezotolerans]RLL44957.1 methylated-DNA--[protein]-cysteine S-methyltransferase [Oceanobacillus piezotolerans]